MVPFTRLREGERLSATQYNQLVDVVEALLREQSSSRVVSSTFVSTRPELPFAFLAEITGVFPFSGGSGSSGLSGSGSDVTAVRYGFRAVRWDHGGLIDSDPIFASSDDGYPYAVEVLNQDVDIGDVVLMTPGAVAPYEFRVGSGFVGVDVGLCSGSGDASGSGCVCGLKVSEIIRHINNECQLREACLVIVDEDGNPTDLRLAVEFLN